jgi:hypothetical protein
MGIGAIGMAGFVMYRKRTRSKMDRFKDTMHQASDELGRKVQEVRSQAQSA